MTYADCRIQQAFSGLGVENTKEWISFQTDERKQLLIDRYVDCLSIKEICEKYNKSRSAIDQKLHNN